MAEIRTLSWEALDLRTCLAAVHGFPDDEAVALLAPAIARWDGWDWAILREVQARVEAAGSLDPCWLGSDSPWLRSPLGRWLLAGAWNRLGRTTESLMLWDQIISARGPWHGEALLERARLRRDMGDVAGAFCDLGWAARAHHEFSFLTKVARLLDRMGQKATLPGRPIRIALLLSSTGELLAPIVRLACFAEGLSATIYLGPYGNQRQEILDSDSGLYDFAPDVVVIGTHWRDAGLGGEISQPAQTVDRLWAEASELWHALLARRPCTILQHSFDMPYDDAGGYLASGESGGRIRVLRAFNARLWSERPQEVVVVDLEKLAAKAGLGSWEDVGQWYAVKQHPGALALPRLAHEYGRLIRARIGLTKKVLVLDLDDTLWGGIVGEDGVNGLQVGPPTAIGEAYAALQRYIKELGERGILLVVCSKNNESDAKAPFLQHEGMILKEDDFVAFAANWREKHENLREIAAGLNLGLESFVFLDDNPVERERMRREMPEVAVVELGTDPAAFVEQLHMTGWFESVAVSEDDRRRRVHYHLNASRAAAQEGASSLESFLRDLRMRMQHGPVVEPVLPRVAQLLGKTNQFNLTTRRHGLETIRQLAQDSHGWTQYFRLLDCYGDNGIIGAVIALPATNEEGTLEIDTFLMSCRVIGRGVEAYMLRTALLAAKEAGYRRVRGLFLPTRKNALASQVYLKFGFTPDKQHSEEGRIYVWDLERQTVPDVPYIEPLPLTSLRIEAGVSAVNAEVYSLPG